MNQQSKANSTLQNPPKSFWIASTLMTDYPTLNEDLKVDVAIIGGGMVGITIAYLLAEEGLKVAVLEAGGSYGYDGSYDCKTYLSARVNL
ncbi:FAD-dependent oxidoreductase [Desulfosporosinus hippei]|uniref:FAD dependent oxidoreductase n=1 Tax=Desulfosporosinus hippei DSM 8344 TaxID=1121419 RepID=A0A1G7SWV9_9FIRM|nr:FAD-dependent oxidoreductase [Desulfosporosinus hippei]SDG27567.1 FAD dependent oxidoreductase [Desulfosporosinus hippei DSM 8344]